VNSFYWDMNDATRAFARRFAALHHGRMPTMAQAAVYSGVYHYLRAVKAAGTDDGPTVAAKMKELPVEDFYTHGAKSPEESHGPWDYVKLLATIPGADAVRPVSENPCPFTAMSGGSVAPPALGSHSNVSGLARSCIGSNGP